MTSSETTTTMTRPATGAVATLAAALLGFFVVTLDAVIVNVALPAIRADLGGGITGLQWVVDGYTLLFAAFLLSAGSLTDRIGAKRAFGLGVGMFVLSSLACGVAPALPALVVCRFLQGAAAALVMPSSMALIGQAFPDPARRARAVAVWAMGGAVASSVGPVLGGVLTLASWRWIFLINLPAGAVALALLARVAPSAHHRVPFDRYGQVTGVVAMAALVYGAIEAGRGGLTAPQVVAAFALAIASMTAFVLVERRVAAPMLPLDLFRSRTVVTAVLIGFAFMVGYYGMPFVVSLLLQQNGLSAVQTGTVFLPMMLAGLVLTPLVPRLTERVSTRPVVTAGLVLMAAGLVVLALLPATTPGWVTAAVMVLVGLGGPAVIPPVITVLLGAVGPARTGTASGVLNTSRQLGGALAVAVFGALLNAPAGLAAGTRVSLLLAAGVTAAAAFAAVALPVRTRSTKGFR
ncbi:MFS transporter [Amycolatopsis mediterranei]|nr:MFS transporter [Amycolatopsis mediterranei]AEK42271.1 MFS transporter methylenomycin A resistance protein [Amycolatopsis mediterranei S699]UZF70707.1 MFS transporter [Amycolatopsis mediterranei]